jgi:hypothetical protein
MNDRVTMLPDALVTPLQEHLQHVKVIHEGDLNKGFGVPSLPDLILQVCVSATGMGGDSNSFCPISLETALQLI